MPLLVPYQTALNAVAPCLLRFDGTRAVVSKENIMAKRAMTKGMHGNKNRKQRGRSSITNIPEPSATNPKVPQEIFAEVNRGVTASGNMNKHRGDRRDTNRTYTGNAKHASRGSNARRDVSTRAR